MRPAAALVVTLLRVATINIPAKVGAKAWETCWRDAADRADVFGVNESGTRRQRRLYRRLARRHGWSYWGLWRGPNPVFWNSDVWRLERGSRMRRLHYRLRWWPRWPGYNSARWATVVRLRHRRTGEPITIVCTHLVPRGQKVHPVSRRRARAKSQRRLNQIIGHELGRGRTVIPLGDVNADPPPELRHVVWIADGIDQIGVAHPRGVDVETDHPAARFRAPTDHRHGVAATIHIERTAA